MSSTLTALTEATTFATTDLGLATVSSNSRKYTFSTLGKLFGNGTLPFAAGTITTSQPMTLTQTWNAGGVAFKTLQLTVTDTASASKSRAIEVVMPSSTSKYAISTSTTAGGSRLAYMRADGSLAGSEVATADGATAGLFQTTLSGTTGISVRASSSYGFSSDTTWWGTEDVQLWRDATACLAQRSGTTTQVFRLYRTYTDSSNYERLSVTSISSGSIIFEIAAETAGTGTDNLVLALASAGTSAVVINRGVTIPAGGATNASIQISSSFIGLYVGSGVPTVSVPKGSLYLRSDGSSTSTRLYINTDGATAWTNIVTAT